VRRKGRIACRSPTRDSSLSGHEETFGLDYFKRRERQLNPETVADPAQGRTSLGRKTGYQGATDGLFAKFSAEENPVAEESKLGVDAITDATKLSYV